MATPSFNVRCPVELCLSGPRLGRPAAVLSAVVAWLGSDAAGGKEYPAAEDDRADVVVP